MTRIWKGNHGGILLNKTDGIKQEMGEERADSLRIVHGNGERDVDNENINKFSLNSRMSEQNVDNEVEWFLEMYKMEQVW